MNCPLCKGKGVIADRGYRVQTRLQDEGWRELSEVVSTIHEACKFARKMYKEPLGTCAMYRITDGAGIVVIKQLDREDLEE